MLDDVGFRASTEPTYFLLTHYSLLKKVNLLIRIQPHKTFHVSIQDVAKLLGIPPKKIVRIENWANVLFVHRRDIGGQFVSYRRLRNWQNAVAMTMNNCFKHKRLKMLWRAICNDRRKFAKQYRDDFYDFVSDAFLNQWNKIFSKDREKFYAKRLYGV